MRLRFTVLVTALSVVALTAIPQLASAAPQRDRGLTIHAAPRSIIAGEAVLIYGRLASHQDGKVIRLYHRIAGHPSFSLISVTKTVAGGRYEFTRAEDVVQTNRNWFVRGPGLTHSATVHERVSALISLAASSASGITRHAITFSGHLTPDHAGSVVLLQEEKGSSDDWTTLKRGAVGPGSNYQIPYAWRTAGAHDVRVLFRGDARNTPSVSDVTSVIVQQAEVPSFTINTSDPIVPDNTPATISGTLYAAGSTSTVEPGMQVQLFGHLAGHAYKELQSTTTGTDGSYSFTVQSTTNELYVVRTVSTPKRSTAQLFEGVQDSVTLSTSATTSTVGGHISLSGTVSPDKAGHVIYLQKLGQDGDWHTVQVRLVNASSNFQFGWTFGAAGTKEFRARITGGPANVGGASAPVTVAVTLPPISTLPTS